MQARLTELGVNHHLRHPVAGQFLADITFGDVFLEPGEDGAEQGWRVPKQCGVGHAARVKRVEHNPGLVVVAAVELAAHHHVAQLAVFVGLAGFERPSVDHRHRGQETGFQA